MLGDVVVQFEGHEPALGFLGLHHAVRQGPQHFLVAPGLRHVGHHDAEGGALGPIPGQRTNREVRRHLRTAAAVQERLDFRAGFGRSFQERSQSGLIGGGE